MKDFYLPGISLREESKFKEKKMIDIFTVVDDSGRITLVSLPCSGEGYRVHVFADGTYVCDVCGHCAGTSFILNRHWSVVGEAKIYLRGKLLTKNLVDKFFGLIQPKDFEVIYEDEDEDHEN
ncbi:MAG: hypothetical protein US83_C0003G0014 [Candidatus Falkowbacteria bacterium GW2011_GWC2_38_22]|uniref:Uncharacterized protein n=1 Tax=Candidatus Falkowbacteria bacterium GW2011_GWE1_38_31 TaxID=1618638 RepID=A0A0G0MBR5_9BACT|nr:MAG: hypothetical protein US73_C0001G0106 [Candidatus Falkowbacteria bacterium GW2011_GWF2_38_1205]KKQ61765.1 MAG: hypothetical protein US83_C0003G0014 [Candidatus Falkowbacteria bacterium GW2011_GWC2_38_22]KKQ64073.1 MAG: hypothetical protein US84_C0002G0105 [Candidatus Falkowbacteria bacterium GW2011_GWF1_38_22]KKQ66578.1 MAG: hypothetical protein US87_C0001G0099 [Candidatus Falkowbacteria bacterium GW2011_GWE2_38_254]KKQ71179.1 MAG: hypothetical protein US91_C0001G0106 [Candidatus Falkowb